MRLVQFHVNGEEWFINPDKIWSLHKDNDEGVKTTLELDGDFTITVDETLKTVVARINNQELNVAYDCMSEIERVKEKIKKIERTTQPCAI
jgi:archaellum component FlaC